MQRLALVLLPFLFQLFVGVATAADLSADEVYPVVMSLFDFHKEKLKARGFGSEPSLIIDDSDEAVADARVNTMNGIRDSKGLVDFYEVYLGGAFLKNSSLLQFLTVAAHELGHLNGDGPRDEVQLLTAEGEADYQSGRNLLPFLLQKYPKILSAPINTQLEGMIAKEYSLTPTHALENAKIKILAASYLSLNATANVKIKIKAAPSKVKVPVTSADYPDAQERWATVVAGLLDLPRPTSWAAAKDFR